MKAGQARESVRTGTCSVPNTHKKQSQWVEARNGQAMNVRRLQFRHLEPPMIGIMGCNQSGDNFDEMVYSLFSCKPLKDAEPGTYNDHSHPSAMTCFQNNISPDVMKFIGVLQMVKGLGLIGMTTEELLRIAVAVYLLK